MISYSHQQLRKLILELGLGKTKKAFWSVYLLEAIVSIFFNLTSPEALRFR